MSEHERTVAVGVSRDSAFRYLSSVANLSSFVPHLRDIHEDESNHVCGVAELEGKRREMSGFFRADEANSRLDWESDGTPGYRGSLRIEPDGKNRSRITAHLSLEGAAELPAERVERDLERVVGRMRDVLEQKAA
jgi:hypothetical protein